MLARYALLVEFSSVVEAVTCAMELARQMPGGEDAVMRLVGEFAASDRNWFTCHNSSKLRYSCQGNVVILNNGRA
jgi:hypothetical protein